MTSAIIAAAVALVAAIVTIAANSRQARTDRRYAARRAALMDAQDAALSLRSALFDYGQSVHPHRAATLDEVTIGVPARVDAERAKATGRLDVALSRVQEPHVVRSMGIWREVALLRFIDVADVTDSQEEAWFAHTNTFVALSLENFGSCQTTESQRSGRIEPRIPEGIAVGERSPTPPSALPKLH